VEDPQALHFREMLITCDFPVDKLFSTGEKAGIIPGIQLDEHRLLISTTELQTRDQLDQLVELIGRGGNS
jgi:glycine cleavage system pyridoxal-binding protein P